MESKKVKCRTCGCTDMYETSEYYKPGTKLTGDQLRLQEPFRSFNWPVYEGALPVKETSRFSMFCTRCMGYISTTGELDFIDGPDEPIPDKPQNDNVDELIIGNTEDSAIKDDPQNGVASTPESLFKKDIEPEPEPEPKTEATYKQKMAQMKRRKGK